MSYNFYTIKPNTVLGQAAASYLEQAATVADKAGNLVKKYGAEGVAFVNAGPGEQAIAGLYFKDPKDAPTLWKYNEGGYYSPRAFGFVDASLKDFATHFALTPGFSLADQTKSLAEVGRVAQVGNALVIAIDSDIPVSAFDSITPVSTDDLGDNVVAALSVDQWAPAPIAQSNDFMSYADAHAMSPKQAGPYGSTPQGQREFSVIGRLGLLPKVA